MKKILKFLIILLSIVSCYGQTKEPTAMKLNWHPGSSSVLDPSNEQFQQTEFLTGFQWGDTPWMNVLMKNNASAGEAIPSALPEDSQYPTYPYYNKSIKGIKQPSALESRNQCRIAPAMIYDPSLQLGSDQQYLIRPDAYDPSNTVFGFKTRDSRAIYSEAGDENYSRIQLTEAEFGDNSNSELPVLSNISIQPNFETEAKGYQANGYFGEKWYLSLNLRRLISDNDNTSNTQKVLKVKIKYTLKDNGATGYIKFRQVPTKNTYSTSNWVNLPYPTTLESQKRGIELQMAGNAEDDLTDFMVYASAIPLKNRADKDITLSGEFTTAGNPRVQNDNPSFSSIKSIDIEVYYNGVVDVGIDWIKIESINAYWLSRGKVDRYDIYIQPIVNPNNPLGLPTSTNIQVYGFRGTMNSFLETMNGAENVTSTPQGESIPLEKLFRIYAEDAESIEPRYWFQLRYLNLLTNGLSITRDLPYLTEAYDHYTKAPNRYLGIKLCESQSLLPAPWVLTTNPALQDEEPWRRMNLKWGPIGTASRFWNYERNRTEQQATNPLNSGYETDLMINVNPGDQEFDVPQCSTGIESVLATDITNPKHLEYLDKIVTSSDFIQIRYEWSNRRTFYNHPDFLYSGKPWFMNFFLTNEFSFNWGAAPVSYFSGRRPHTGEESRLLISGVLLKGAKGLFYDRESRYYRNMDEFPEKGGEFQLGMSSPKEPDFVNGAAWTYDYANLMDKRLGDDYIFSGSYPKAISSHYWDENLRKDIENTLGVEHDKLYLGMRSTRLEVYKIHSWIRRLEETNSEDNLMNLRLVAWKGKGFKTWYNQDPAAPANDSIMKKYILINKIRTAKLYQPNAARWDGGNFIPATNFKNVSDDNRFITDWEGDDREFRFSDSSFYDITILRHKDQKVGETNKCYLGIQNRRTDPLIYEIEKDYGNLKFYSTAEFEDLCHSSDNDTLKKYRDYYWKRLGCRLIYIPLSYSYDPNSTPRNGVQIKELLADDDEFNKENARWRDKDYTHLTNFYQSGSPSNPSLGAPTLKIRMLPGEGKMLKLTQFYYPKVNNCPDFNSVPMKMNLAKSFNDSLSYDLVFANNTETKAEQMVIIFEAKDTESISITPKSGVEISNYYEEDADKPNCKAIILRNVEPYSKIKIGQLVCSKKNSGKFLYQLEVQTGKNERCSEKLTADVSNFSKKSADDIESTDNRVSNISIAPNPAKDRAELSFNATEQGNAEIIVVDILGNQLLHISDYIAYPGTNSLNINLSNFSGGVYNVIVKTISGVSTQKFSVVK